MRTLKLIKFRGSDRMQNDGRGLELRRLRATPVENRRQDGPPSVRGTIGCAGEKRSCKMLCWLEAIRAQVNVSDLWRST